MPLSADDPIQIRYRKGMRRAEKLSSMKIDHGGYCAAIFDITGSTDCNCGAEEYNRRVERIYDSATRD